VSPDSQHCWRCKSFKSSLQFPSVCPQAFMCASTEKRRDSQLSGRKFTCGKSGDANNLWSHPRIIHKDEQRLQGK
jgi:hypothetical protein